MKRGLLLPVALFVALTAHIGSPDVVFQGKAGAYTVEVVVRPPDVVPGLADVIVRVEGSGVQSVVVRPVFWRTGVAGAPKGDEAKPVSGQTNLYESKLWLMSRGSSSVYVTVSGSRGSGTAIVPVSALATARLGVPRWLGVVLIVLGGVLFAGLITIVRAASGEALLDPGETLSIERKRRVRTVGVTATIVLGVLILGGAKWWTSVDDTYQRTMYRPPAVDVDVHGKMLDLRLHDTAAFHALFAPVIPDHGKMMHLFLIEPGAHAGLGHFHADELDSLHFRADLSGWPKGKYELFADVVLANGLSQTVTTMLDWPGDTTDDVNRDGDDSWWPLCTDDVGRQDRDVGTCFGYRMAWAGGDAPIVARQPVDLRFDVRDDHGEIARLRPYMGMAGHAIVLSQDDSVFIHLHPMGTVSTSAQATFAARDRGDTTASGRVELPPDTMAMPMNFDGHLSFPYEFPKPGRYRIWVQVRPPYAQVMTGAFDIDVR